VYNGGAVFMDRSLSYFLLQFQIAEFFSGGEAVATRYPSFGDFLPRNAEVNTWKSNAGEPVSEINLHVLQQERQC